MNITDIFIKRPVLSTVVSLLILTLGLKSVFSLTVRQFPETQNATVSVTTTYFGASPEAIAGYITAPLEQAISEARGIDYLTSSSNSGISTIDATLRLNYDAYRALSEINTKINSVKNQLPAEAQDPQVSVSTGSSSASMYINFRSNEMATNAITDYLLREVQPKLQTLPGIQSAEILGARNFALRAWLDSTELAGYDLTAGDVRSALASQNYISALGYTKGQTIRLDLSANTNLNTLEEFRKIIVKQNGSTVVRLEDVARVTLGSEDYETEALFDGVPAVFMGITVAPNANLLDTLQGVREAFPAIQRQFPSALSGAITYDASKYVDSSIDEVLQTLLEALVIVTVVLYLFIGNFRSVLIPVIAMPLSLIGTFLVMLLLGYTINLLTLLALVLAIGLVVDDAIIVVENVDRHIKEGASPLEAAFKSARELTGPIIAMTVVLVAVYVPIGFQGGLTGSLFAEFAFTLAGAVTLSGIVALTLSPMMCSRFLNQKESKFQKHIDTFLGGLSNGYGVLLDRSLLAWKAVVAFGFLIMAIIVLMTKMSATELAPEEDQAVAFSIATSAPNASSQYMSTVSDRIYDAIENIPEKQHTVQLNGLVGSNTSFTVLVMKPWDEREKHSKAVIAEVDNRFKNIPGFNAFVAAPSPLPGGSGGPGFQMVIKTTEPFSNLYEVTQDIMQEGLASGKFFFLDTDLKVDKPRIRVNVDRDLAASMGLTMSDIGNPLSAILSGSYVNYFNLDGRAYKIIPQVSQLERLNPEQIGEYYLRNNEGKLIPASSVVSFETEVVPQSLNRFGQLNAATIQGVPNSFAGVTMGDAIAFMNEVADRNTSSSYSVDYAGVSRQTINESSAYVTTMGFALLIIFLVLAAQFESFRDPVIVMATVPMAIFGAMVFIFWGTATLNIYTQVGLVTLVGLIARHGILLVEFANEAQKQGKSRTEAIKVAARIRLRPILMTSAATVLGVLPLVLASGAGAEGRFSIGLVIAAGITIGTLFTLFVVPSMYIWLGSQHQRET